MSFVLNLSVGLSAWIVKEYMFEYILEEGDFMFLRVVEVGDL